MKENLHKPGLRIDNGVRRDLNKDRVRDRMLGVVGNSPSPAQATRSRIARHKQAERQAKNTRKLLREDGGKEGTRISVVKIRLSNESFTRQAIRAKPGTFEWRYGRNKQDALFHAGSHLARLWERAGVALSSSADFLRGTTAGYATGISDGRVAAIDKLAGFRETLGLKPSERLIDYCVLGLTSSEIAKKHGIKERDMAPVLHQDLRDCALHFHFVGK